jgi:hypothetical protein
MVALAADGASGVRPWEIDLTPLIHARSTTPPDSAAGVDEIAATFIAGLDAVAAGGGSR